METCQCALQEFVIPWYYNPFVWTITGIVLVFVAECIDTKQ